MKKNEKHTKFVLTDELISKILDFINSSDDNSILETLSNYHHADIAEIIEELNSEEATYIIKLLDSEKTSDVLMELDDDYREKILKNLSIKEIAEEVEELDSDDATDIISELPEEKQKKVISKIIDAEHKADIKELLKYDEDSAGGLMAKELIKVNENWTVTRCVKEMRSQASEVTRVHSVYVVDNDDILLGRLSLKDLLVANPKTKIKYIYKKINLPIKQIDEKENFRRIIDLKNNSGWIHVSQLKKVNSLIPKIDKILFSKPTNFSKPLAKIEKGRVLLIQNCNDDWCKVKTGNFKGWVKIENSWGVN